MIEILVDGRGAQEVDLVCPKCSDPDLAEKCTIVIIFDDRNIGGRTCRLNFGTHECNS